MKRDQILGVLRRTPGGLSISDVLIRMGVDPHSAEGSAVESFLFFFSEVRQVDGRWQIVEATRSDRILAAIESYSLTTGRRLFRAATALESLPLNDQPTIEELSDIFDSSGGKYSLLPNAMIKRNE